MDATTVDQSFIRISILIPCEIDDTKKLTTALAYVAQRIHYSKNIRGYAGDDLVWTIKKHENNPCNTQR